MEKNQKYWLRNNELGDKVKKCKFVFDLDATVLQVIEVNVEKTLELLNRKFGNEFV